MNLRLRDRGLVADVALVDVSLVSGKSDLQHGNDARELQLVETLVTRHELVDDGDVADLVDLVQALNTVLDELGKVDGGLDSVRDTLNNNSVVLVATLLTVEQLPSSLKVSANADTASNTDLVLRKSIFLLLDSNVSLHLIVI